MPHSVPNRLLEGPCLCHGSTEVPAKGMVPVSVEGKGVFWTQPCNLPR